MTTTTLSGRAIAILRAVAAGRVQLSSGLEPDLFVDGLPCCDQMIARELLTAGLIRPTRLVPQGEYASAILTELGAASIQ